MFLRQVSTKNDSAPIAVDGVDKPGACEQSEGLAATRCFPVNSQKVRSMTNISYEAAGHRLRLEGDCWDVDLDLVEDAVEAFQRLAGNMIIDLTAVTDLSHEVAEFLVLTQTHARSGGARVTLVRHLDGPADHALVAVGR